MEYHVPSVSIVLPVYNAELFLEPCLQMLAVQDFVDYEIIAIDDGSSDGSLGILRTWEAQDSRIRVFTQGNQGPGLTRNVGLDRARGEYVTFLDPDDLFHPTLLSKLFSASTRHEADVSICASHILDYESGTVTAEPWTLRDDLLPGQAVFSGQKVADDLFRITIGWPWDKLFKLSFLQEHGLRFPDLRNSEDGVMVFPAVCLAKRITVVAEPLIQHTMNRSASLSYSRKDNALCFFTAMSLIRTKLQEHEVYEVFERGYLNWALHFCLWNLNTAHPGDRQRIYEFLKDEGFDEIGVFNKRVGYYLATREYRKAQLIKHMGFKGYRALLRFKRRLMRQDL
jgi:glycosyltransferase involved in cell wall biosynthesis